jgi:hypothetical protein
MLPFSRAAIFVPDQGVPLSGMKLFLREPLRSVEPVLPETVDAIIGKGVLTKIHEIL